MMTRMRRAPALLAFALPFVSAAANAQPKASSGYAETKTGSGTGVIFDDDLGTGMAFDPFGDIVRSPPRAARMMLLRPRYNFVPEMLKSVENL